MTRGEEVLRAAVADAEAVLGLIVSTLRATKQDPIADVVEKYKNRASATLALADAIIAAEEKEKTS
jgi:methylmalonyl-CoA mutase cobalamin-binding subunit